MTLEEIDQTGLIRESYRIEAITDAECRSIFLDWLLKVPSDIPVPEAVRMLIDTYATSAPDHPMSRVLQDALRAPEQIGRRGGAAGRRSG